MIFKDLLEQIDKDALLSTIVGTEQDNEKLENFTKVIDDLNKLEPAEKGMILVAVDKKNNNLDENEVLLFDKSVLVSKVQNNEKLNTLTFEEVDTYSGNEAKELIESQFVPVSEAVAAYSWEEILGAEVSEANAEKIGKDTFAAIVLEQITFLGFDNEELKDVREALKSFSTEAKTTGNQTIHELKTVNEGPHHLLCGFGIKDKSEQKEKDLIEATKKALKNKLTEYRCIVDALGI